MKKTYLFFALIAGLFACVTASAQTDAAGSSALLKQEGPLANTDFSATDVKNLPDGLGVYELNMGDFTHLNVVDGLNVVYHVQPDSAGIVSFVTTKDIASNILFSNNNKGKLTIEKSFHPEDSMKVGLPVVHVYGNFLTDVTNAGDSTVRVIAPKSVPKFNASLIGNGRLVVRDVDCEKLEAAIKTGNGTLTVTGRCKDANLKNTGVGTISADGLKAEKATCRFFGKGTTGVWAEKSLTVKGMFPGKVYYKGKPEKIHNYAAGVKVIPLEKEL